MKTKAPPCTCFEWMKPCELHQAKCTECHCMVTSDDAGPEIGHDPDCMWTICDILESRWENWE